MHEGGTPDWRQTIDRHHAMLLKDLASQLNAEVESSVARALAGERTRAAGDMARASAEAEKLRAEAIVNSAARASDEARRRLSESLNQTLRRMRQTSSEHETLQLLLEDSSAFAAAAVVLAIESNQARVAAWRGVALREGEEDASPFEIGDAAAIASCVESRDPVVALADPGEISAILASALKGIGAGKVYLFPVTVRQSTVAVVIAAGEVTPAPLELLCEAAGMRLESPDVTGQTKTAPLAKAPAIPLVQIAGTANGTSAGTADVPASWAKLTPEQQALHLRAQRTARVRVAQMRIGESEALRRGIQSGSIYGALRTSIDAARDEFQRAYVSGSPTMVDYLHLEMMRSLAHGDTNLLGRDYPGPIT
jgi:hypothetical protein